ncbi:hypothetical protein [Tenacibaculum aiptasiae]|nr:hypothetical protein [Tenacibaculum aiptasiae]
MIAKLSKEGVLKIIPQQETEVYALEKWYEENPNFADDSKIFIQMNL